MATMQPRIVLRHIRELAAAEHTSQLADRLLLDRFLQQYDAAAFETLVRRHGPMVVSVCRRILGERDGVEDAFQATFLVLASRARGIAKRESVGGWLHRVAANTALKVRGREATRRRHENAMPTRSSADLLEELTARELFAVLDEELRSMPERHRGVLVLCYPEGQPRDEAARQLGWTLGTLKRRLDEARRMLRGRLVRRGVCLPAALAAVGLTTAFDPQVLTAATARAARLVITGDAAALSSPAMRLASESLRWMPTGKVKLLGIAALVLGLLCGAGSRFQPRPMNRMPLVPRQRNQRSYPSRTKASR